jgi:hypothetical protein
VRPRRPSELSPALFNYLRDYAIDVAEASKKRPVPEVPLGPLTVFVDNFFGQFFPVELNTTITGFSQASHEKATKARLKLEQADERPEASLIISSYESYCRIHPDIEQERSVPDDAETLMEVRSTLLESFLPELLNRIEAWAAANGNEAIVEAVTNGEEWLDSAKLELGL